MDEKVKVLCNHCKTLLLEAIEDSKVEIVCHRCKKKFLITVKNNKEVKEIIK